MEKYILAIDQSTSGTKAILVNHKGQVIHGCALEHRQFYPQAGWVEHDPEEIYTNTLAVIHSLLKETQTNHDQIESLAITNQRETIVVWDKYTGKPIYNAIVWQCHRNAAFCRELREKGYDKIIKEKTGLVLAPYFSAAKAKWIIDNVPEAQEKANSGHLLLGTIDTWLLWKLTGGKVHATDYSNASRTQLFNIKELKWDEEILELFKIPSQLLPAVRSSNEIFGYTSHSEGFTREIPISGLIGDSHAALFGQNCFSPGMAKATYGTGSSIMMNIGKQYLSAKNGLVTSLAWGLSGEIEYVFEGNINCTGAIIKWLVDDMELIPSPHQAGVVASSVEDNGGVYLVPAFVGLGAPYWDSDAKALIYGMTRGSKKAHIIRAAEEAIAYQIKDIIDLMIEESRINLTELRVDGGPTRDEFLMQFQANILDVPVTRSEIKELSALGAAYISGLTTGFWNDKAEIASLRIPDATFISRINVETRQKLYGGWKEAVRRSLSRF